MRVLVTADAVGGVWTYALDLAAGLAARVDEVVLAILGPAPSLAQRRAAEETGAEVVELGGALDWMAEDLDELAAGARALAGLARRRRMSLIHLNSPALAAAADLPAPVVGVAHSCLATWWAAVERGPPPQDFAWRIAATAHGYAACDAVLAPTAAFAAATEAAHGVAPLVVHNGRRKPFAETPEPARDIAAATVGRLWDRGKGAGVLDAAAAEIDAPILAVGPVRGPQGEVAHLPNLVLTGGRSAPAVAQTLARTRVFVSSALYEPFGLAVLEAAQAGCALVLSDIPSFRELWRGAAVFTPPGDAGALAGAVNALLADDARRERLALAARVRAQRYDLDRFVEGVAAVHRAVIGCRAHADVSA